VESIPDGALALCLISGGGSALVEALQDGVGLEDLQSATRNLLASGASIHELNSVRSRLSLIKGGGLLFSLRHARVVNLIISDVIGDDLHTIASGPTVPAQAADADAVVRTYAVDVRLPRPRRSGADSYVRSFIIANNSAAVDAAADASRSFGYEPIVLTRTLAGEARHAGSLVGAIVADSAAGVTSFGRRSCFIAGGETTVTVRGDGIGGRNTEAALAAAIRLTGVAGVALGFLATDGDDAATGAAGAIVDGDTVDALSRSSAEIALDRNDSFTFLRERGAAVLTGPTGTNVNDLAIGVIG
jgi:hydroxypyruvate reductase